MLRQIWQYTRAFSLIYLCLFLGNMLTHYFSLPIPGSIIGMLLLFILLALHIIPAHWVKPGCQLLLRFLTLLFVPISVGIMVYYDLLISQFGAIVVSCILSSFIVLIVVGFSSHFAYREKS